ncbi:vWA domain-containing protein [Bradyrhizobium sp.]|uniref:vWA domain-containing protein n=1 Tax=Bradyrhizobium sp. TaxID=376 RepID=UPI001EC8130F|nr:vWA domain-containing protein [Bradyrhizobium sp.]MBV9981594.1 VWA domain-containing protein [Bradyrhizobium sp.]
MSYQAEISRASPTAILMVMDQSTSMNHRLNSGQSKAAFLADVLNKTLYTIITNCSKADGVRDYFHVGVVAYGGEKDAGNGFQGALGEEPLHVISRLAEAPLRVETRTKKLAGPNGDLTEQSVRFPIWFEPRSKGKTSMCAGLNQAVEILDQWCAAHPSAFPPTVLHITDGHPSYGDPEPTADRLKSVATDDGGCLLFNLHVDAGEGEPLIFPNDERAIQDRFGKMLFRMSSLLPPHAVEAAARKGYDIRPGARGFVFNAGIEAIADFFDIGTRPAIAADR